MASSSRVNGGDENPRSHFSGEMERAAAAIITAAKAGDDDLAHFRVGALVGMAEANSHGVEVWWDQFDQASDTVDVATHGEEKPIASIPLETRPDPYDAPGWGAVNNDITGGMWPPPPIAATPGPGWRELSMTNAYDQLVNDRPGFGMRADPRICSCSGASNVMNVNPQCPTHGVFRRGAPKTPEAAAAAFDAITAEARRRHDADLAAEETRIHSELTTRVSAAMEAANEQTILVDWDCMANETVVQWDALAEAAVDAFADYYRQRRGQ